MGTVGRRGGGGECWRAGRTGVCVTEGWSWGMCLGLLTPPGGGEGAQADPDPVSAHTPVPLGHVPRLCRTPCPRSSLGQQILGQESRETETGTCPCFDSCRVLMFLPWVHITHSQLVQAWVTIPTERIGRAGWRESTSLGSRENQLLRSVPVSVLVGCGVPQRNTDSPHVYTAPPGARLFASRNDFQAPHPPDSFTCRWMAHW